MDASTVRESVIRPKLQELFGTTLTDLVLTRAIVAGMKGRTEQEKLYMMVDAICSHPKVVGMLGVAQAERQKQQWLTLV